MYIPITILIADNQHLFAHNEMAGFQSLINFQPTQRSGSPHRALQFFHRKNKMRLSPRNIKLLKMAQFFFR